MLRCDENRLVIPPGLGQESKDTTPMHSWTAPIRCAVRITDGEELSTLPKLGTSHFAATTGSGRYGPAMHLRYTGKLHRPLACTGKGVPT